MNYNVQTIVHWDVYIDADKPDTVASPNVGKWMYFFLLEDLPVIRELAQKAMQEGVVTTLKHSNEATLSPKGTGVMCFYLDIDDISGHKRVIDFFLEHGLIRESKSGRLYNISFKLDKQTQNREYGADYKSELKLSELMDLKTREWLI